MLLRRVSSTARLRIMGLYFLTTCILFLALAHSAVAQEERNRLDAVLTVYAPSEYLLRGEFSYTVNVKLNISVTVPLDVDQYWIMLSMPYGSEFIEAKNLPFGASLSWLYDSHLAPQAFMKLPHEATSISVELIYKVKGTSTFLRTHIAVTADMFKVRTNILKLDKEWNVVVILPEGSEILPGYPQAWPPTMITVQTGNSTIIRTTATQGYMSVGYQPFFLETYAVALVIILSLSAYLFTRFALKRSSLRITLTEVLPRRVTQLARKYFSLKVFLAGFLVCSTLILAIGAVASPRPEYRVLIMGNPTTSDGMVEILVGIPNVHAFTVAEVSAPVLEHLVLTRGLDMVVLADLPVLSELGRYPLRTLISAQLNDFVNAGGLVAVVSEYMDSTPITVESYGKIFYAAHQENTEVKAVNDVYDLKLYVQALAEEKTANPSYSWALKGEALLLTMMAFFGTAFLTTYILEDSFKESIYHALIRAIMGSFFVFGLAQLTVIWAGRSMETPLATHYGAFGFTGYSLLAPFFGGGNILRAIAGFLGFIVALLISEKKLGGISWKTLLALALVVFIITVNPLTSGVIFVESVQVFISGETFYISSEATVLRLDKILSSFLFSTASLLNIPVTPALPYLSRGVALWLSSALLLAIANKMKRPVKTVLLLFSAVYIARGIARVGDMSPTAFMGSFVPGVALGIVLIIGFYVADRLYDMLRERIWVRPWALRK